MGKSNNIQSPQKAAEIFEQYMSQGLPVFDSKGNELALQEDEEFRQCYDENDSVRKVLPTSWFVSNHGNLISVYHGRPEWLLRDKNKNRDTYHFSKDGKIKIISSYALVGLCFNSPRFGTAEKLLEDENVYCFGNHKNETNVQTHHVADKKKYENLINDPENLIFMTSRAHKLCHSIPAEDATAEERKKFMEKFGEVMSRECPNSIVVAVRDGDSCKLYQQNMIVLSKESYEYLLNFQKSLKLLMES